MARMLQVSARELVRFLKSQGFIEDRQSGAHLTLRHAGRKVTVLCRCTPGHVGRGWLYVSSRTQALPLTTICG
jgi:predicted RNA binding protein YcfA (HicA-like mRNA interferase family)